MAKKRKAKTKVVTKYRTKAVKAAPRRRGKRSLVSKLKRFAIPAGIIGSFVPPYLIRSKESGQSVSDLLLEDFKTFSAKDAMTRVKAHIPQIVAPIGASVLIRETRVLGKFSGVAADLALGIGIGTAAKAVIDPPFVGVAGAAPVAGGNGAPGPVGGGMVVPAVAAGELVSVPHGSNPYEVI